MKKKTFGIVVVFAVIIIICAVIIFDLATKDNSKNENSNSSKNIIDPRDEEATGAFYDTEPVMKGYRVSIHSTEAGHRIPAKMRYAPGKRGEHRKFLFGHHR